MELPLTGQEICYQNLLKIKIFFPVFTKSTKVQQNSTDSTRHLSITAIAKAAGKEQARKYSGHLTNKAFDRYCQIDDDDTFDISQLMAKMRGKVVSLKTVKNTKK